MIDRVDQDDSGHIVVMDYKSSKSTFYRNHPAWIKNKEFQLLFYLKAVESGWTKLSKTIVDGAFYYFIKNWERDTGISKASSPGNLFELEDGHKNNIGDEAYTALMDEFEKVILDYQSNMASGIYQANPKDPKECPKCEWKSLCRAPHLN